MKASPMNADVIRVERPTTNSKVFAHTRWDAVPAAAGFFHLAYFVSLFFLYPHAPLWVMLILGFIYSLMVNASINGVGHNFIHNPFFRKKVLNRLFRSEEHTSELQSLTNLVCRLLLEKKKIVFHRQIRSQLQGLVDRSLRCFEDLRRPIAVKQVPAGAHPENHGVDDGE